MASKARARILTAAEEQFAAHGFAGTSTKDIARAADVHESTLFRLFGTKEALFHQALEEMFDRVLDGRQILLSFNRPGLRMPVLDLAARLQRLWHPRGVRLLLFAILERPDTYHMLADRWRPLLAPLLQRVQEMQAAGQLRDGNASRMTEALGDAIFVWYLLPMVSAPQRKALGLPPKASGRLLEMFVDGMRNHSKKRATTR